MTSAAVAQTSVKDSRIAGSALAAQIKDGLRAEPPDAVVLFASAEHDHGELIAGLEDCRPRIVVGCSSAGEFAGAQSLTSSASALAIRSTEHVFSAGLGQGLRSDLRGAARQMTAGFHRAASTDYPFHTALVLTDALAGHAEELLSELTVLTGAKYRFVGGGAGDDARFTRTHVFFGGEVFTDAVVALEIRSQRPLGIGVSHGWHPVGRPLRITEAREMRVIGINGAPAAEILEDFAAESGQVFDRQNPLPFFLHNVLGIETGGGYKLRVPLQVHEDGSLSLAAEIPQNAMVRIMSVDHPSAVGAAARAVEAARAQLNGAKPAAALFFDCAATRLRMGHGFNDELQEVEKSLSPARFAGCNTYGQLARDESQFSGFHNCTAVVCLFPG
ncbi:MAG: FIST signal transduction protein [Bryobacteraceae bacterium]